jgi:hypothetical protein
MKQQRLIPGVALLTCLSVHAGALVQLTNPDGALRSAIVFEDSVAIGRVGDYHDFGQGTHHLNLSAPHAYSLHVDLQVTPEGVPTISESREAPPPCKQGTIWETKWTTPTLALKARDAFSEPSATTSEGVYQLAIATPVFVKDKKGCSEGSAASIGCLKASTLIDYKTVPQGASVYVNGELQTDKTDTENMRVLFCSSYVNPTAIVEMKLSGYASCVQKVGLQAEKKAIVQCALKKLP